MNIKKVIALYINTLVVGLMLAQDNCYIRLDEMSGLERENSYQQLVDSAYSIIQIWPEEYRSEFNVFGKDFYLHVPTYYGQEETILPFIIDSIDSISQFYLAFLRESDPTGIFSKLHIQIKIPTDEEYPCLTQEWLDKTRQYISSKALSVMLENGMDPLLIDKAELKAMSLFKSELSRALYCCESLEGVRTSCPVECKEDDIIQKLTNSPSVAPGDLNQEIDLVAFLNAFPNVNRFILLEGISQLTIEDANYSKVQFSGHSSYGDFAIESRVDGYGDNVHNMTDWLEELAIGLESNGLTHRIAIHYYDATNINQLFLQDFSGENSEDPKRDLEYDYEEDIIVINCTGFPRVLSKIKTNHFASQLWGELESSGRDGRHRILPALIARELIRRAFMAGMSVAFNVGVEIAIEKIFSHGNECTWRDAWNGMEISVWDIMVWSAEGAIGFKKGQELASAMVGGLSSAFQYLMNTPSSQFGVEELFSTFATDAFLGLISGVIGEYSNRIYKKFTDHLSFEGRSISNEEFGKVAWLFVSKPGTIKAWKEIVDEGFDEIRINEDALDVISNSFISGLDGADPLLDAAQTLNSNKWSNSFKSFYGRGNAFNQKAKDNSWWPEREITVVHPSKVYPPGHSKAGQPRRYRLDGYDPVLGKRVSRKATSFDDITEATWIQYLDEIDRKYPIGAIIKKPGSPLNDQQLTGDKILEVPEIVNLGSEKRERFEKLAADREVTVVYKPE